MSADRKLRPEWVAVGRESEIASASMQPWLVRQTKGSAESFHKKQVPESTSAEVWIHRVDRPALVLGSTQNPQLVNHRLANEHGVEVCQRNSGGGLLRVQPWDLWLDVILPRSAALWDDDVGVSMIWLGNVWAAAFAATDLNAPIVVHQGPLENRELGKLICFAGLGSGEVLVDGRKVVGISQRRTRTAARFQCLVKLEWAPRDIRPYLQIPTGDRELQIPWDSLQIGLPKKLHTGPTMTTALQHNFLAALPGGSRT